MLPEFRDGAWVSELAPAGEAEAMLGVVATTFSVQQRIGSTLEESIVGGVAQPRAAVGARQLRAPDRCRSPASSTACCGRRPACGFSRRAGKASISTASTSPRCGRSRWPTRVTSTSSCTATPYACSKSERARCAKTFGVDAANATTVDELCRRLDGIPLAIELAASRVASLGVPEILALLDERFRLLTGGRRMALERHQTLRAAVDWSYSLLRPDEAVVFDSPGRVRRLVRPRAAARDRRGRRGRRMGGARRDRRARAQVDDRRRRTTRRLRALPAAGNPSPVRT